VPDGQYTQTIYQLIHDQKYQEVSVPILFDEVRLWYTGDWNFDK